MTAKSPKYRGAGDVIAAIAKPVAAAADLVFGTNLSDCPSCRRRQEKLNRAIPLAINPKQIDT